MVTRLRSNSEARNSTKLSRSVLKELRGPDSEAVKVHKKLLETVASDEQRFVTLDLLEEELHSCFPVHDSSRSYET